MSLADIEKLLVERLLDNPPGGYGHASIKVPNARFSTPNDKWLRATMITPVVIDRDASNCFKQYEGIFVVDVFESKNEGSHRALNAAEEIRITFENVSLTDAALTSVSITNVETSVIGEEENWYHAQVNITYQFGTYTEA